MYIAEFIFKNIDGKHLHIENGLFMSNYFHKGKIVYICISSNPAKAEPILGVVVVYIIKIYVKLDY